MNVLPFNLSIQTMHVFWVLAASLIINKVYGEEAIPYSPENVTKMQSNVSCGNDLFASKCSQCPFDKNGYYHGGFRCSGDCKWLDMECKQQGADIITGVTKLFSEHQIDFLAKLESH